MNETPTYHPPPYEPGPLSVNNAVPWQVPAYQNYNPNQAGFGQGQPQFTAPPSVQKAGLPSAPSIGQSVSLYDCIYMSLCNIMTWHTCN